MGMKRSFTKTQGWFDRSLTGIDQAITKTIHLIDSTEPLVPKEGMMNLCPVAQQKSFLKSLRKDRQILIENHPQFAAKIKTLNQI